MSYQPVGDKKNSDAFNEYLPRIYQRRAESGFGELVVNIAQPEHRRLVWTSGALLGMFLTDAYLPPRGRKAAPILWT